MSDYFQHHLPTTVHAHHLQARMHLLQQAVWRTIHNLFYFCYGCSYQLGRHEVWQNYDKSTIVENTSIYSLYTSLTLFLCVMNVSLDLSLVDLFVSSKVGNPCFVSERSTFSSLLIMSFRLFQVNLVHRMCALYKRSTRSCIR